jgi:D-amino-acid dehydrogenase
MARIAVVGAGVVGVASAYVLCRAGHDVVLVDRHPGPGQGASRANGAQLSYAYGDALASPGLLAQLPGILVGRYPAHRFHPQRDPEFLLWGLRFLIEGLPSRFAANTRTLLEMAAATRTHMRDLLAELDLAFDHVPAGKMHLYPSVEACERTADTRRLKASMGIRQMVLDRDEATAIEPALDLHPDTIGAVLYSPDDAVGRPDVFCAALVDRLAGQGALTTLFGHDVAGVLEHKGRVVGLTFAAREPRPCERVVFATGAGLEALPRRDRPYGRVWPVQGYSITVRASDRAMRTSITDVRRRIVFARLGDEVRAAGIADIGARRPAFAPDRFATFKAAALEAFGGAFDPSDAGTPWSGGRPCTPSSVPIVRPGRTRGLYLHLGHSALGWTLCLGSAARLVEVMDATS